METYGLGSRRRSCYYPIGCIRDDGVFQWATGGTNITDVGTAKIFAKSGALHSNFDFKAGIRAS
jgi:hypothetical protein